MLGSDPPVFVRLASGGEVIDELGFVGYGKRGHGLLFVFLGFRFFKAKVGAPFPVAEHGLPTGKGRDGGGIGTQNPGA